MILLATHGSPYAGGESCMCSRPAKHKVGEEDARSWMHNYTTYVCCSCFGALMGTVAAAECARHSPS